MRLDKVRTEEGRPQGSNPPAGAGSGLSWTVSHRSVGGFAGTPAQGPCRESPFRLSAGGSCPTAGDVVVVRGGTGWWGAGRKRRWLPSRGARAMELVRTLAGIVLRLVGVEGPPRWAWSSRTEVLGWPQSGCEPDWDWAPRRPGGEEPALWGNAINWTSGLYLSAVTVRPAGGWAPGAVARKAA